MSNNVHFRIVIKLNNFKFRVILTKSIDSAVVVNDPAASGCPPLGPIQAVTFTCILKLLHVWPWMKEVPYIQIDGGHQFCKGINTVGFFGHYI